YWPLAEILKAFSDVLDSDPPSVACDKIAVAARRVLSSAGLADVGRAAAALAYTVGIEHPQHSFRDLSPRQVSAEILQAWRAFFSALAAERPVVAVFEDIHWADSAMLAAIQDLADRVQGPLLIVSPSRLELTSRQPSWGGGRRNFSSVFLAPLAEADAEELIGV